jgi:SagB-type dehydrogenase family enzyme
MFNKDVNPAEEYHFASRNVGAYKFIKNEHLVHYRDDIVSLKTKKFVHYNGDSIQLLKPIPFADISFETVLAQRISHRDFDGTPISKQELSDLLYYSNGYRDISKGLKFVPSSGGLNSVELYAIVLASNEIPLGIYHYEAKSHSLEEIKRGDFRVWSDEHIFFQEEYCRASVVLVLTSMFGKLSTKYGLRSYRLSLMDVGLVSQNIYLVSSALHLKACASAGFIDEELDSALGIDGYNTSSFLTISIGK